VELTFFFFSWKAFLDVEDVLIGTTGFKSKEELDGCEEWLVVMLWRLEFDKICDAFEILEEEEEVLGVSSSNESKSEPLNLKEI
jgi:hypothetical protein